jgi:hypothetical protein
MQAQLLKKIVGIIQNDMNKFGKFNNHALVVVFFYTFMHFFVYHSTCTCTILISQNLKSIDPWQLIDAILHLNNELKILPD